MLQYESEMYTLHESRDKFLFNLHFRLQLLKQLISWHELINSTSTAYIWLLQTRSCKIHHTA